MITIYGISTCDTTKKAMAWLKKKKLAYNFHDYRVAGIDTAKLEEWCSLKGWETILNKKSTTWRALDAREQAEVTNQANAVKALSTHTTLIKRPIIQHAKTLLVGYDEKLYEEALLK